MPSGLFAGKSARAELIARLAWLHAVGLHALEAEAHANQKLTQAHTLHTEASRITDYLIEKAQRGAGYAADVTLLAACPALRLSFKSKALTVICMMCA